MNLDAAFSTGFVHFAGIVLALLPLGQRHMLVRPVPEPLRAHRIEAPPPALALVVVETEPPGAMFNIGPSLSDGMSCPYLPAVDQMAEPDFPLFGEGRPFRGIAKARVAPVFCARIGRNGRILELRQTAIRSGNGVADQQATRELARLRFRPARRDGRPVEAWHRVLVNLPDTVPTPVTDSPTPCLLPEATTPCTLEPPIIPTD